MATAVASASLSAATTGNGATVDFTTAVSNVSMFLAPSASVTGGMVEVQVSHDGTSWATVHHIHTLTTENSVYDHPGGAHRYWRASIVDDITGGGTVTATFMSAG